MNVSASARIYLESIPEVAALLEGADVVDIKTASGDVPMREFIAGMLNYQPGWVTFLYAVRWVFVRLLGMKQTGIPKSRHIKPEALPMNPGERAYIFRVEAAQENHYWIAGISESHLTARLGVVADSTEKSRYYVVTIVHYHRWTGWFYFNVIRPFHHVVVGRMLKAGSHPVNV